MSDARAGLEAAVKAFQSGWNAHDAAVLSQAFHVDAHFVNRFGRLVRGRDEIAAMHAPIFRSVYRDSEMTCWVETLDSLAESAAYGFVRFDLKMGEAMPHGPREVPGRMMVVITREAEGWLIKAAENVAMVDPITGEPNANL